MILWYFLRLILNEVKKISNRKKKDVEKRNIIYEMLQWREGNSIAWQNGMRKAFIIIFITFLSLFGLRLNWNFLSLQCVFWNTFKARKYIHNIFLTSWENFWEENFMISNYFAVFYRLEKTKIFKMLSSFFIKFSLQNFPPRL